MKTTLTDNADSALGFRSDLQSRVESRSFNFASMKAESSVSEVPGNRTAGAEPIAAAASLQADLPEVGNSNLSDLDNAASHQGRSHRHPQRDGRGGTKVVDTTRHSVPHPGAQDSAGRTRRDQGKQDHARAVVPGAAQSSTEEGDLGELLRRGTGHVADRQRGDEPHGDESHGDDHEALPSPGTGPCGLREALQGELHDHPQQDLQLRPLGGDHMEGEWQRRGQTKIKKEPQAGGYLTKEMIRPKDENEKSSSSNKAAASPTAATVTDRLEKQMAMMADTMESLRKELAEVKGERPRKAKGRNETEDEAMTDDSFRMVHPAPGKKG